MENREGGVIVKVYIIFFFFVNGGIVQMSWGRGGGKTTLFRTQWVLLIMFHVLEQQKFLVQTEKWEKEF